MKTLTVTAILMFPVAAAAETRFSLVPSVEVTQVHDDNLYFSHDAPVRDRIRRVTPALALRFDSPRWSFRGSYGIDAEEFEPQSSLDNTRARERAAAGIVYEATPRVRLSLGGGFVNTDTLADLNAVSGLASSRARAQRLTISPSIHLRVSPRWTASASASSISTVVQQGDRIREQSQELVLERAASLRDRFTLHYQHSAVVFEGEETASMSTHTLLGGFSRTIGPRTALSLRGGPRFNGDSITPDASLSISHSWRTASVELSLLRTQTTVIGQSGLVETEGLETTLTWTPMRRITAHVAPAVIRSSRDPFDGTVYRLGLGLRYAITGMLDVDVAYTRDTQHGAIDALRADAEFSRSTLSVGLRTRWARGAEGGQ